MKIGEDVGPAKWIPILEEQLHISAKAINTANVYLGLY
jgi:hypothetical protein